MEYTQLVGKTKWTSSDPNIYFSIDFLPKRNGLNMSYSFKVKVYALDSPSYFAYPIYLDIILDETTVQTKKTLKKYGEQYQTWSEIIWESPEYSTTSNKISGTIKVKFRFYSGYGSSRDSTYTYELPIIDGGIVYIGNEPYQCYIGDGNNWNLYVPYIGNGISWDQCG